MSPRLDLEAIKQRVHAARAGKGLPRQDLVASLDPGAVFAVKDDVIDFPDSRLPGATRTLHDERRVIVVQAAALCRTSVPVTLQVVPVTASFEGDVPPYFFELPEGESGFDAGRKVALTQLVQPVLKSDLERYCGQISAETLVDLMRALMVIFGLAQVTDILSTPSTSSTG